MVNDIISATTRACVRHLWENSTGKEQIPSIVENSNFLYKTMGYELACDVAQFAIGA